MRVYLLAFLLLLTHGCAGGQQPESTAPAAEDSAPAEDSASPGETTPTESASAETEQSGAMSRAQL